MAIQLEYGSKNNLLLLLYDGQTPHIHYVLNHFYLIINHDGHNLLLFIYDGAVTAHKVFTLITMNGQSPQGLNVICV